MAQIHVAAAIIRGPEGLLAAKRADVEGEAAWEFPGGKLEAGESAENAVRREIFEELGCHLQVVQMYDTFESSLGENTLVMDTFVCTLAPSEQPQALEHADLRWVKRDDLMDVAWLEADRQVAMSIGMFWDQWFEEEHL